MFWRNRFLLEKTLTLKLLTRFLTCPTVLGNFFLIESRDKIKNLVYLKNFILIYSCFRSLSQNSDSKNAYQIDKSEFQRWTELIESTKLKLYKNQVSK